MFKFLLDWVFARDDEPETAVVVHDFTDCKVGHDITLRYNPEEGIGYAVITSLEKIQVGEFINVADVSALFIVTEVKELGSMIFQVEISLVEGEDDHS